MNIEELIGRQGHAMVLVRVLQLMCSGDKPQVLTLSPPPLVSSLHLALLHPSAKIDAVFQKPIKSISE
jgi:hypothetical protein